MEKLTQAQVLEMTKGERQEKLDHYQDLACNTDYTLYPELSDTINTNIHILESKIIYNEF